jgi:hypothetical protein
LQAVYELKMNRSFAANFANWREISCSSRCPLRSTPVERQRISRKSFAADGEGSLMVLTFRHGLALIF